MRILPAFGALCFGAVVLCHAGCGNGAGGWQNSLSSLASSDTGVYSFRFDGAPPDGAFYRFSIHDVSASAACERYSGGVGGEFWYLEANVNDTLPGDHAITLVQRHYVPTHTANVTLLHRQNGAFVDESDAVSGTVTLSSTPSAADANAGAKLEGHVEADFPVHALTEVSCQGGQAVGSTTVESSCTCRDDHGQTSTCVPANPGQGCCHDLSSSRVHASFDLKAAPCGAMCAFAAGLPGAYCESITGFLLDASAYSTSTCGTSACEQRVWPRLLIGFGDAYAAGLTYIVTADDGFTDTSRAGVPR